MRFRGRPCAAGEERVRRRSRRCKALSRVSDSANANCLENYTLENSRPTSPKRHCKRRRELTTKCGRDLFYTTEDGAGAKTRRTGLVAEAVKDGTTDPAESYTVYEWGLRGEATGRRRVGISKALGFNNDAWPQTIWFCCWNRWRWNLALSLAQTGAEECEGGATAGHACVGTISGSIRRRANTTEATARESSCASQRSGLSAELATQTFSRFSCAPAIRFLVLAKPVSYADADQRTTAEALPRRYWQGGKSLADWWRELLGVERRRPRRWIFRSRWSSLIAVRLVRKIKKPNKLDFGLYSI